MDIQFLTPRSGRMIKEDGTIINIADALAGDAASVGKAPINSYSAASGRMIREDGTVINIADEIANGNIGGEGGGGTSNYNDLANKPTINGVEVSGNKTSADYKISAEVTRVDHGTSDTTFELPANQYHTWGEVASLTLTLGSGTDGQANGYWFSFDSGDTATTLSLPETVQTDIIVEPNMHYECSIVGDYMTFEEWEATA